MTPSNKNTVNRPCEDAKVKSVEKCQNLLRMALAGQPTGRKQFGLSAESVGKTSMCRETIHNAVHVGKARRGTMAL